jgi:hypothetical protein
MKTIAAITRELGKNIGSVLEQFIPVDRIDPFFFRTYEVKMNTIPVTFSNLPRLMTGK